MKNGAFSYYDPQMGQSFELFVDSVREGSMQAATRQAVVVIECQFPMGGTAAAYLFDERENSAVLLGKVGSADWGADWGAPANSIQMRFADNLLHVDPCKNIHRRFTATKVPSYITFP